MGCVKKRLVFLVFVTIFTGCGKSNNTGAESKAISQDFFAAATIQPAAKKPQTPRLTPKHKFKSGIRDIERLAISDDGSLVAVGTVFWHDPLQVEVWSLGAVPKKLRTIPGGIRGFSTDGKLSTRLDSEHTGIEVVDTGTGALVRKIFVANNFRHVFEQFVGPEKLVVASNDSSKPEGNQKALIVGVYNARTGLRGSGFEIPSPADLQIRGSANENREIVVGWNAGVQIRGPVNENREIVVGWQATGRVEVWDLNTGKLVRGTTLKHEKKNGNWAFFEASPDGKRVSLRWEAADAYVGIYDLLNGAEIHSTGRYDPIVFVPGRSMLLEHRYFNSVLDGFESQNGWSVTDLTSNTNFAGLANAGRKYAMSSDGRFLVTVAAVDQQEVAVWDLSQIP